METSKPITKSTIGALWEFEGDNGFEFYKKADSNKIEAAHKKGDPKVKIKVNNAEYEIDFTAMTQLNTTTKKSRKVKKILVDAKALDYNWTKWKVKLDDNKILEYDLAINQTIEQEYKKKSPNCTITTVGKQYIIDFAKMKQINLSTQYERDLIRESYSIPSDAIWIWLDDSNKYSAFDMKLCKKIEKRFKAGIKKFLLSILQFKYEIDLTNFIQTNQESKKSRSIKRIPLDLFVDSVVWEWEGDEAFSPYASKEIKTIEDAFKNKKPNLKITKNGFTYTIDLTTMKQTNDSTKRIRAIRRLPSIPKSPPLAPTTPNEVVWECNSDNGFKQYPASFCTKLNEEIKVGHSIYSYTHGKYSYSIDFTIMKQINKDTNKARDIRKAIIPGKSPQLGAQLTTFGSSNSEYVRVKNLFDKTMSGKYKKFSVTFINNPGAKLRFDTCFNLIKNENSFDPRTMLLFHGTSSTDPKKIYDGHYENFDVKYSKAGLWGKGIYFATDASYSCNDYVHKLNGSTCSVLLGEVIIGNYYDYDTKIDGNLQNPPNLPGDGHRRYDSVTGITKGTRVYVIYTSNQAYAKYLITYTT